jgi:hypothetical protein
MPMTMESGPTRCSTRVLVKPTSFIQAMQSAPDVVKAARRGGGRALCDGFGGSFEEVEGLGGFGGDGGWGVFEVVGDF